jgi:hypothetical protein
MHLRSQSGNCEGMDLTCYSAPATAAHSCTVENHRVIYRLGRTYPPFRRARWITRRVDYNLLIQKECVHGVTFNGDAQPLVTLQSHRPEADQTRGSLFEYSRLYTI